MTDNTVRRQPEAQGSGRFVRPVVMQRLASATRDEHQHIENNPLLARLLQTDDCVTHYRRILAGFYGFYRPLEEALLADPRITTDPALRFRLGKYHLLAEDLRTLGMSRQQIEALPRCGELPPHRRWQEVLGVLYVMEGATLGGQLIRKHLLTHMESRWHGALRFYSCYGNQVGAHWRGFQQLVDRYLGEEASEPENHLQMTILTAKSTFGLLDRWLATTACLPTLAPMPGQQVAAVTR